MNRIQSWPAVAATLVLLAALAWAPAAVAGEPQSQGRGTRVCDDGSQCDQGEFCKKKTGKCDKKGKCEPRPEACTEIFDPVCGCDGQTYGNECQAWAAGVSVAHEGECEPPGDACTTNADCAEGEYCSKAEGDCDGSGSCAGRPEICTKIFDPVCGCDGQTYGNPCEAAAAGVSVASRGECDASGAGY